MKREEEEIEGREKTKREEEERGKGEWRRG